MMDIAPSTCEYFSGGVETIEKEFTYAGKVVVNENLLIIAL